MNNVTYAAIYHAYRYIKHENHCFTVLFFLAEYNDNLRQNGRERFKPYKRCKHRSENNMKYIMDIVKG